MKMITADSLAKAIPETPRYTKKIAQKIQLMSYSNGYHYDQFNLDPLHTDYIASLAVHADSDDLTEIFDDYKDIDLTLLYEIDKNHRMQLYLVNTNTVVDEIQSMSDYYENITSNLFNAYVINRNPNYKTRGVYKIGEYFYPDLAISYSLDETTLNVNHYHENAICEATLLPILCKVYELYDRSFATTAKALTQFLDEVAVETNEPMQDYIANRNIKTTSLLFTNKANLAYENRILNKISLANCDWFNKDYHRDVDSANLLFPFFRLAQKSNLSYLIQIKKLIDQRHNYYINMPDHDHYWPDIDTLPYVQEFLNDIIQNYLATTKTMTLDDLFNAGDLLNRAQLDSIRIGRSKTDNLW